MTQRIILDGVGSSGGVCSYARHGAIRTVKSLMLKLFKVNRFIGLHVVFDRERVLPIEGAIILVLVVHFEIREGNKYGPPSNAVNGDASDCKSSQQKAGWIS